MQSYGGRILPGCMCCKKEENREILHYLCPFFFLKGEKIFFHLFLLVEG